MNTLVTTYFIWRNVFVMLLKLSDFVLLNYLATTFFNLATVFPLKVAKWRLRNFFNFVEDGEVEHQVGMRITSLLVKRTSARGTRSNQRVFCVFFFLVFLFPPLSIKYRTY